MSLPFPCHLGQTDKERAPSLPSRPLPCLPLYSYAATGLHSPSLACSPSRVHALQHNSSCVRHGGHVLWPSCVANRQAVLRVGAVHHSKHVAGLGLRPKPHAGDVRLRARANPPLQHRHLQLCKTGQVRKHSVPSDVVLHLHSCAAAVAAIQSGNRFPPPTVGGHRGKHRPRRAKQLLHGLGIG